MKHTVVTIAVIGLSGLSGLAALAASPAALAAPAKVAAAAAPARAAQATQAVSPTALYDLLEQEKQNYGIYKAYFPGLEIARKAAISFHAQLLESNYQGGYLVLELDAAEMDKLRPFGFRFEPATDYIQRRNQALTRAQQLQTQRAGTPEPQAIPGYACYETVEETFAVGDSLIAARPGLASWVNAGPSWQKVQGSGGYDLRVLKLTNANVPPPAGGVKPRLFINAAIHAREYTTAPLVLEFARWLVNGHGVNADATWMLDYQEIHLLLQTNPDGRKRAEAGLSWRKNVNNNFCANTNTRGIDLNRNFSATWNTTNGQGSSGSACSLTFRGPAAGSEPETQAVEAYIRNLWPDRRGPGPGDAAPADTSGIHLDIHSFSQLVLWPWGETAAPAPNGPALQTLGRRLAFFNGYTPQQSIGLYSTDGTSDAPSYAELGVASFTIELGTAFFESCTSYNNTTKPANLPALIYAARVTRAPYLLPGGPDVTALVLGGGASGAGVAAGTVLPISASATDLRFNNSNGAEPVQAISAAQVTVDVPPWDPAAVPRPLAAADGSFNGTTEAVTGSIDTLGLAVGPHTVYVRARDASGAWGPVSAVFLNINAVPLPLPEREANNTLATAQAIDVFPTLIWATMDSPVRSERSDVDHYRVVVQAGRTLTTTLMPNAASDYNLQLLDANGNVLAASTLGTGEADVVAFSNSGSSAVTLFVRASFAGGGNGPVDGRYSLSFSQL